MSKILIIEDEHYIARLIQLELERDGYETTIALNGKEGVTLALTLSYNLIILDLMLPEMSGDEICKAVREVSDIPIIMVTARDDIQDKIKGLDMGADDYITKPFVMEELSARVRRAISRRDSENQKVKSKGRLTVDPASHCALVDGQPIPFTKKEYDVLCFLIKNEGAVVTREQLLQGVWGYNYYGDTNVVDVYIRYIRSKLDDGFGLHYIHTLRGVGYMFKVEVAEQKNG